MFLLRQALRRLVRRHLRSAACDRGASGVEHGILAGLVAVAIIGAVALVGGQLAAMFTGATYALRGEDPPGTPEPARMVMTFDTSLCSEAVELPVGGDIGGTVDWGDGTEDDLVYRVSHTYTTPGEYVVTINGTFETFTPRLTWRSWPGAECLTTVDYWGDTGTVSLERAFEDATNLTEVDSPPATVANMAGMFAGAKSFNQPLDWDTSNVTDMSRMFMDATSFNQPLDWDTSNVTDMSYMFMDATSFNQPLDFDTSNVTDMSYMFSDAEVFNQPLDFDTSNVTDMRSMFSGATSFDQPLDWDTSNVTDMSYMFRDATSFNQPLDWDTSNVTDMSYMFYSFGGSRFNGDISTWNTSSVTDMASMFSWATSFNQDISQWDVSSVTNMAEMFWRASDFDQDLSEWDVAQVTNHTNFDRDATAWQAHHKPVFN